MKYQISMSSAEINDDDIQAVVDVMRSGRLALGPQTRGFEHAVVVNSGVSVLL
jgi:dTDP-4-amino-4,6-dideoxygalactose transaminase